MLVTFSGIVMSVSEEQQEKALSPILLILFGIEMERREVQSEKAKLPMLVTPISIVTLVIDGRFPYQGAVESSGVYLKSVMSPSPEIMSSPVSKSVQMRLSPHMPLPIAV